MVRRVVLWYRGWSYGTEGGLMVRRVVLLAELYCMFYLAQFVSCFECVLFFIVRSFVYLSNLWTSVCVCVCPPCKCIITATLTWFHHMAFTLKKHTSSIKFIVEASLSIVP